MEIVSLKYFFFVHHPDISVVEIQTRFKRSEDYEWIRGLVTYILFSKTSTTSFQESRLRFSREIATYSYLQIGIGQWGERASDRDGEYLKIILLFTRRYF